MDKISPSRIFIMSWYRILFPRTYNLSSAIKKISGLSIESIRTPEIAAIERAFNDMKEMRIGRSNWQLQGLLGGEKVGTAMSKTQT
jgi:hypothetical protein